MRPYLLLALLLVLAQQGAWLHELTHATYSAGAHQVTVQQSAATFDDGLCPTCQSFGQLGSALSGCLATSPSPLAHACPQARPQCGPSAPDLPLPRSRGPPLLA